MSINSSKELLRSSSLHVSLSVKNFESKIKKGEKMYPDVPEDSDFAVENEIKILNHIKRQQREIKDFVKQKDESTRAILQKIKSRITPVKKLEATKSEYYQQYQNRKI